jgi:hypothetical protein
MKKFLNEEVSLRWRRETQKKKFLAIKEEYLQVELSCKLSSARGEFKHVFSSAEASPGTYRYYNSKI